MLARGIDRSSCWYYCTLVLSTVAENAARKRAELGDTPKKTINQTMYLVKWEGLGYEYCTWETKEDVGNSELIAEFHRLNNTYPDEPDMPESVVSKHLSTAKHLNMDNAGGSYSVPELRMQLYAQTRALQFSKFGWELPKLLCGTCGPKTKASTLVKREDAFPDAVKSETQEEPESLPSGAADAVKSETQEEQKNLPSGAAESEEPSNDEAKEEEANNKEASNEEPNKSSRHPRAVVDCVFSLVDLVAKEDTMKFQSRVNASLPPLLTGEYDAIVPITAKGLMMNVGEIHGSVAFLGYRSFPDGSKGPAELGRLIRNVGDKIIAVDGVTTVKKTFQEVIGMLKESGKNKYAYMRFLETQFSVCDSTLASVGDTGKYAIEELQKKFSTDRERILVQRKKQLFDAQEDKPEESDGSADAESEEGSEGEFEPDSDAEDDELMKKKVKLADQQPAGLQNPTNCVIANGIPAKDTPSNKAAEAPSSENGNKKEDGAQPLIHRHETTRSLAYRLMDVDIGNSSDEGGDDDCAFYYDGMDETFTSMNAATELVKPDQTKAGKAEKRKSKSEKKVEEATVPSKRNEFMELGTYKKTLLVGLF